MSHLTPLPLALHVFGMVMWIGGLIGLVQLLTAAEAETGETRQRILQLARKRAVLADIGATLMIGFGLYWLFKYELYKQPYMHIKLTLAVVMLGLYGFARAKSKRMLAGGAGLPRWFPGVSMLLGLAIIVIVFLKVPFKS